MLRISLAFAAATAILLMFTSTRPLGAVALFVALCLKPLAFGALALLAAAAYLLLRA